MYSLNCLISIPRKSRSFSNSAVMLAKNHYNSLGITPKATQSDVKSAYYKLSMIYHPDKNEGSDSAAQKFRDITEAYEVLGNVNLRRLYDKGAVIGSNASTSATSQVHVDPTLKFYKSRESRMRPPMTGRTPIYDFDEWAKSHYGATFQMDMERKQRREFRRKKVANDVVEVKTLNVLIAVSALLGVMIYFSSGLRNHDIVYKDNELPKDI